MSKTNCLKQYKNAVKDFNHKKKNILIEIGKELKKGICEELCIDEADIVDFSFEEDTVFFYIQHPYISFFISHTLNSGSAELAMLFTTKKGDVMELTISDKKSTFTIGRKNVGSDLFFSKLEQEEKDWLIKRIYLLEGEDA